MVEAAPRSAKLHLNVNGKTRDFDISHVDSLWKMRFTAEGRLRLHRRATCGRSRTPATSSTRPSTACCRRSTRTRCCCKPEHVPGDEAHHEGRVRRPRLRHPDEGGQPHRRARCCPKTPAFTRRHQEGRPDHKIGEESTVNMDLNEAVVEAARPRRLEVTITVDAQGLDKPQVIDAHPRAHLHRVGAVASCSPATSATCGSRTSRATPRATCRQALTELDRARRRAAGGMQRPGARPARQPGRPARAGDPGLRPLLSDGTIVATVSAGDKLREEKKAHADDGDDDVADRRARQRRQRLGLGDRRRRAEEPRTARSSSAGRPSARARCRCSTTSPTTSALKLTIAKYLTPGDVSHPGGRHRARHRAGPDARHQGPHRRLRAAQDAGRGRPRAPLRQPANATAAKKREDLVHAREAGESLRYLKEDAKQKDAAAASRRSKRARTPSSPSREARQGGKPTGRRAEAHRRRRSRQAGRGPRRPARRRGAGRGEGGLRGPLRPRLRAQGARSSSATRCSQAGKGFVERDAGQEDGADRHRHRRARRRLEPGRHAEDAPAGRPR